MGENVLLLYESAESFRSLQSALAGVPVQSARARTCAEAREHLRRLPGPHLVFTDVRLPDGTWREALAAAESAAGSAGVVVVNRFPDDRLYILAMCSGATDFIAPPFNSRELAHVISAAFRDLSAGSIGAPHGCIAGAVQ